MTRLFEAVIGFPFFLALLCVGVGLTIDRVGRSWIPRSVIPVVGLAGLIAIGQLTTTWESTARLTLPAYLLVAGLGFWLGRGRLRFTRQAHPRFASLVAATSAAYLTAIAPVLFAGRPTLSFYLTDTTVGTHLAGADWLIHHGRHFTSLPVDSSWGLQILNYFQTSNYPSGAHVLLAGVGDAWPVDLIWLFQPYMAFVLCMIVPSAWYLLRRLGGRPALAGLLAFLTAIPALVYALDLVGSIKELTALPLIVTLGVFTTEHKRWIHLGGRAAIPYGVVVGAGASALGLPFLAWGLLSALVIFTASLFESRTRWSHVLVLIRAAAVATATATLSAPAVVAGFSRSRASAEGIATTTDPGNLLKPLSPFQAIGIWIAGQYRLDPPQFLSLTYGLIGVTLVMVAVGASAIVRARAWSLGAWLAAVGVLWWQLSIRGTVWTDGKLILLSSPLVVLVAGAAAITLTAQRQRLLAFIFVGVLAFGITYSDAQQYHVTNLAPTARYDELLDINRQFSGRGPTLLTDFDELAFYALRDLRVSAPGFSYRPNNVAASGIGYGQTADIDQLPLQTFTGQRLIIQRRSPIASRPPSNYRQVWRGRFYLVWQRLHSAPRILNRAGSGQARTGQSVIKCVEVEKLARQASRRGGELLAATRAPVTAILAARSDHSPGWVGEDQLALNTPGRLRARFRSPQAGIYQFWLKGQIGRKLRLDIDGDYVGKAGGETAGIGNFVSPISARLTAGFHELTLTRPGGSFRPGDDAPSVLEAVVISPLNNTVTVTRIRPKDYETLCGQLTDWIEAVGYWGREGTPGA